MLAFFEQRDLNMLHEKALQGWMIKSFKGGYINLKKQIQKTLYLVLIIVI
ncbi:hypothetical protein [Bacillus sp. JJ722]